MPVNLFNMRELLMPGLHFLSHAKDPLCLADVPDKYQHFRQCFEYCQIKTVGDLHPLPRWITLDGFEYRTDTVCIGREYPQGWGRGPGGWKAEPPPEPDGKVNVYQTQDNDNMKALKDEIEQFCEERGYYRP